MTRRPPEQIAILDSWRARWESDPAVTYAQIGAEAGCTWPSVASYGKTNGWCRAPHVQRQTMLAASARANVARWAGKAKKPAQETKHRAYTEPVACPSIWQWASGVSVTTTRRDGRHIEVTA